METIKRGRPTGTFKHEFNGQKISIFEWRKLQRKKKRELKNINSSDLGIDLSAIKVEEGINSRVDQALSQYNREHYTNITKKDFISLCLLRALKDMEI